MTAFWIRSWDALAAVFFPTPCVSCRGLIAANDPPLCPECWTRIPEIDGAGCSCGAPLAGSEDEMCGRCRRGLSVLTRGASLGVYAGPLRESIVALKYQGRHRAAERLALRLMRNDRCRSVVTGTDLVVPVPLHRSRLKERGFNQAELLARAVGRASGVRVGHGLARVRETESQTNLSGRERRRNVSKAFAARPGAGIRNAAILLVDDVTTTGATLRECALTLLDQGAREVRFVTVARAE